MEEEKALLLEIDKLHLMLSEESYGKWNGVYTMEPSGSNYIRNAELMLKKISELISNYNPDYVTQANLSDYFHTVNKEVQHVGYIRNSSSKKGKKELIDSINAANRHIESDLISLFLKIDELKKNNVWG